MSTVVNKTVLSRKILELVPIEATNSVIPSGEPEIPLAVFGNVFNALPYKATVYGISPPDARAVE